MHELGIAQRIVEAAVAAAGDRPVRAVRARVGVRHAADPALLAEAFEVAATGTPAEGATLDVVVDPIRVTCRSCNRASSTDDPTAGCSRCGSFDVERTGGDDLHLESVRIAADGG